MKNCINCNHSTVKFSDIGKIENDMVYVDRKMYVKCKKGMNEEIKKFTKKIWINLEWQQVK